nr:MaoC family dehydratase [uncultured Hyphomonas sp.]
MIMTIEFDSVEVGDELPEHVSPEITRHVLALFCGSSGDHNPMHVDIDFAKSSGMPDVFAHGMLSMAYLAQLLTHWVPQSQLREWNVRFLAITPVHVRVKCTGKIIEKFTSDGENLVRLDINAHTDAGSHTLAGEAVIALN